MKKDVEEEGRGGEEILGGRGQSEERRIVREVYGEKG